LADRFSRAISVTGQFAPLPLQLALADFIARGELERHLRRMRLRYARRREALVSALARELPEWRPSGSGSGLYVLVGLPRDADEPALLATAARHGVGMEGLSLHSYTGECRPGLVVGHGYLAEPAIERGARLLAEALGYGVPPSTTARISRYATSSS
jgi:GntR family transcriptional regulator/MocR family aminotransferase